MSRICVMLRGKAVVMSQFGALPAYCRPMQCAATRGDMIAEQALGTLFGPAPVLGLQ